MAKQEGRITKQGGRITKQEMKEALLRSGYLLETRVEMVLKQQDFSVTSNRSYQDPRKEKSRELDIYAVTADNIRSPFTPFDRIYAILLIECINNPQPLALMAKNVPPNISDNEVQICGWPPRIYRGSWQELPSFLNVETYHHYWRIPDATQYCSFQKKKDRKKNEWMAHHNETHYDSFSNLCCATNYFVQQHFGDKLLQSLKQVNISFYYPILLIQGDLIRVSQTKRSISLRSVDHLQYRQSLIMQAKEVNFHIDVIKERFLRKYLDIIQQEIETTARFLRGQYDTVRESIKRITNEVNHLPPNTHG